MKHRFFSLLTAVSTAVACIGMGFSMATNAAADDDDALKILAVGDSITHGYNSSLDGYRKYLCYYLQQADFTDYDMVGPNNNWTDSTTYTLSSAANGIDAGTTITYDPAHAGYSGYSIQSYSGRTGIYETIFDTTYYDSDWNAAGNMIEAYEPDMILLQIGTNDLLDAHNEGITDRLETLIDQIEYYLDKDAVLFVASVPDIDAEVRNDWLTAYGYTYGTYYADDPDAFVELVESYVDAYNESVEELVEEKQAEGYNIYFADINSVVDMKTGLDDGVHPNDEGYACMGEYWANLILSYVNGEIDTPVTTTASSETTTTTALTTTQTETTTTTTTTTDVTTTAITETSESTTEITAVTTETEETTETTTESLEATTETTEITSNSLETTTATETTAAATQEILLGDVDLNNTISLTDIVKLSRYLIRDTTISYDAYLRADLTQDSRVNGFDLAVLRQMLVTQTYE